MESESNLPAQSQPLTTDFDAAFSDRMSHTPSTQQDQDQNDWHEEQHVFQPQQKVKLPEVLDNSASQEQHLGKWHQNTSSPIDAPAEVVNLSDPRPGTSRARSLWMWEIAACVLSFACLSSIIGVLLYEQGKPLDEWGLSHSISPTAVIAFIGTIGKSACLLVVTEIISQLKWMYFDQRPHKLIDLETFDAASRGPWGAAKLVAVKHKTTLMATSASFIVLLSLLIDPFLQLVFQFPIELTAVSGTPSKLLTSQVYDPTGLEAKINSWGYGSAQVDAAMQAAILSPIWNTTSQPSIPCFFERCEWPTITTLGVCGSCENLTDSVRPSCRLGDSADQQIICNYTLSASNLTLGAQFGEVGGASDSSLYHTLWNSTATLNPPAQPGTAQIGGFSYIKLNPKLDWKSYVSDNTDPEKYALRGNLPIAEAMNCNLSLCARTFKNPYYANFTAGPLSGPKTALVMPNNTYSDWKMRLEAREYESVLLAELKPATSSHLQMNTTFKINYYDYNDIIDYLGDLFSVQYENSGHVMKTTGNSKITPNLGLFLSQNDDIPGLIDSIADSMTEVFRTSSNSTTVNGIGKRSRTFISVRWAWLVLPIAWVVLTLILLIIMILRTRANAVPTWKSSSLPLLFYELSGWSRQETDLLNPEGVREMASNMSAQTVNDKGLLLFQKV